MFISRSAGRDTRPASRPKRGWLSPPSKGFRTGWRMGRWRGAGALAEQGQAEEGIAQMQQGLAALRAIGTELGQPRQLAVLAEAYGKVGQVEEGLTVLAEALALVDKTGERYYEAELYRLKGELTLAQSSVQVEFKVQKSKALP